MKTIVLSDELFVRLSFEAERRSIVPDELVATCIVQGLPEFSAEELREIAGRGPVIGNTNAAINAFLDQDELDRYEHAFHREFHPGCDRCQDRLERMLKSKGSSSSNGL